MSTEQPDSRVQRIAKALAASRLDLITSPMLARVLVEELGGRESVKHATAETDNRIDGWHKVCQALWSAYPNMDAAMQAAPVHDRPALAIHQLAESLNACRAQQRENAETIKTLKEQVEKAERNADVTDKNYEGLFRAAKKMEDDNKRLLAELDAIKGAQRGVKFIAHNDIECTARFADGKYNITWQHGELGPMTLDAMYKTWPHLRAEERAALEALRHPAPAQPVVVLGEVFVFPVAGVKHVSTRWIAPWDSLPEGRYEFTLGAPLPKEGGK